MAKPKFTPEERRQLIEIWPETERGKAYGQKLALEAAKRAASRDEEADPDKLATRRYYRKYISDEERYRAALDRHEKWRKANPIAYAASRAKYYATEKGRLYKWSNSASQRCRKAEVFRPDGRKITRPGSTITAQDLRDLWAAQDGKCVLTGRPLLLLNGKLALDSPSVDRIDTSGRYELGNVRIITWQANVAKGIGTDEDLYAFCEAVLAYRDKLKA